MAIIYAKNHKGQVRTFTPKQWAKIPSIEVVRDGKQITLEKSGFKKTTKAALEETPATLEARAKLKEKPMTPSKAKGIQVKYDALLKAHEVLKDADNEKKEEITALNKQLSAMNKELEILQKKQKPTK